MTLEDLYEGEFFRKNSLKSKANRGKSTLFLDNNFRNYMGEL